jgi:hypothetical protein
LRPHSHSSLDQHGAEVGVFTGKPAIGAPFKAGRDHHPSLADLLLDAHILLHHHGVEAVRHDCACKDADGVIPGRRDRTGMTRGGLADDPQPRAELPIIACVAEGITVDRGVVVRRYVSWGQDGLGKIAAVSPMQIDAFYVNDRPDARLQDRKRLVVWHPVLVVEEAIVAELHRYPALSPK